MIKFLEYIIPNLFWLLSSIYIWFKLSNKKVDFSDKRLYITLVGVMILSIANYMLVDKFIRIVVVTVICMIFYNYLFRETIQKSIVTPIYYQFILFVSEAICIIILIPIMHLNQDSLLNTLHGLILTNSFIGCLAIILVNFKFVCRIYNAIIKSTEKIKQTQLLFFCLLGMLFLNVMDAVTYYEIPLQYLIMINTSIILVCLIIFLYGLHTQNNYNNVSNKYNIAINSLNDYEKMMTKYRISNHENKNLLLTIRAMAKSNNKDIPEYINTILNDKFDDDEKLFEKISKIPEGGLRATIYSEILKIRNAKIDYILDIGRDVRAVDLIELDTDTIISICKIICVFIDNAIEAVEDLDTKEIVISMYNDNNKLNIKISNNFENIIDVNKVFDEGYTTKGSNHGYGLSLVKNLVKQNSLFENELEINGNIFTQVLKIKYKK